MKKKMQKYLSGSNEGFSLVELIIVIAIMAILVGVVALAVIPNLERSRESKDLTTLDNVASALATAVANAGASASADGSFDVCSCASNSSDVVMKGVAESLGDCTKIKLESAAGKGQAIMCKYDTKNQTLSVAAGDGSVECTYQKGDDGNPRKLIVEK